ncbi:flagellar M-ring protein FliF [Novosphingobium sp. SG751A]|uniref:flagellar basal-body MS-ring/collar protein FliF n=1 Tax=Novosphingobium sp. SG751A TaxID=2587000 RepID=UPI0015556638|nr:flagellar basal-body MS-ring/collar protein FliF [Novosphingobium sp. SG751A]NOW47574.1 flagellar M-ring protein FliF [Novosphingobium sp. SG751A]
MADLVPAAEMSGLPATTPGSILTPLTAPDAGPPMARARAFLGQGPVKKALPWFAGVSLLGAGALAWGMLAQPPQRVLYSHLDDGERANVAEQLDKAKITYAIDNATGTLTVDEGNLYKARMVVAQSGTLSMPDTANDSLDKLPMGASRALEGERLRAAREHELMLSLKEIEGVQSVRVHIAEGEKSVFVRDQIAPSASVMLRLADGRQLSDKQVQAVVNLVAGSVPGLSPDAVRVVDQRGRLLTDRGGADSDRLEMQARMEDKLHGQVAALLTPMLGDDNFTSEVQIDLDMEQVTSARESYDKQGAVRSETSQQSQQAATPQASGIPGTLSNTPPPVTQPSPGAPQGTPTSAASPGPTASETSASKNYELGREVAVTNREPGRIRRLSVAVALSSKAMAKAKQTDIDQIKSLVSAAVGADPARGDQVAVVVRSFEPITNAPAPFYEAPWFARALHYGAMLLGTLMVLLLGVRPLIKAIRGDKPAAKKLSKADKAKAQAAAQEEAAAAEAAPAADPPGLAAISPRSRDPEPQPIDARMIERQVGLAQQIVDTKPDTAVIALRQMLQQPTHEEAPTP